MPDAPPRAVTPLRNGGLWLRVSILLLLAEKVIQHVAVTLAFILDIGRIRASMAPDYRLFMVVGAASVVLFALSGWALVRRKPWASGLIVALALVDLVGEFVAQGALMIPLNVSFLVAAVLLVLTLLFRWGAGSERAGAR